MADVADANPVLSATDGRYTACMNARLRFRPLVLALLLTVGTVASGCNHSSAPMTDSPTPNPDPQPLRSVEEIKRDGNHLKTERSVYLQQHAHNPIDWYPWGDEAIGRAKAESKPIFLSIGYASCHWCHVMEHEVFERDDVADYLNRHYISIKVDREERPDIDKIYMDAVVAAQGSGGWPMSVFLTPDLRPFSVGTYIPYPHFLNAAKRLERAFREERSEIEEMSLALADYVGSRFSGLGDDRDSIRADELGRVSGMEATGFDWKYGGSGGQKFPQAPVWIYVLHWYRKTGNETAGKMLRVMLENMAQAGLYDHIGGGFHRYTVDPAWVLPHFEKMLYDNALLASLYAEASVALAGVDGAQPERYAEVAKDTLDYLIRDMSGEVGDDTPTGGIYASYDADSGGEEGSFYVWTPDQITDVIGAADGEPLAAMLGVVHGGNLPKEHVHVDNLFDASQVMRRMQAADVATEFERPAEEVAELFDHHRVALREARAKRVWPGLDKKIISGWNGLAIAAFAKGYFIFGDDRYRRAAELTADYLWEHHWNAEAKELARASNDGQPTGAGILDDYAFLADGLLELYHATGQVTQLQRAFDLLAVIRERFAHEKAGFYMTGAGHEAPLGRQVDPLDNAIPSGTAVALRALLTAAAIAGNTEWHRQVEDSVSAFADLMRRAAPGMPTLYDVVLRLQGPSYEVVIAGDDANALVDVMREVAPSWATLVRVPAGGPDGPLAVLAPAVAGKTAGDDGTAMAFVCRFGTCNLPTSDEAELRTQLLDGWTR